MQILKGSPPYGVVLGRAASTQLCGELPSGQKQSLSWARWQGVKEQLQPAAGTFPVLLGDVRRPASMPAPLPHSPSGSGQAAGV